MRESPLEIKFEHLSLLTKLRNMKDIFKQVPVEGFTPEEVLILWRTGKLFCRFKPKKLSIDEIKSNVRVYVRQLHPYVTEAFRDSIDELWDEILDEEQFIPYIVPNAHTRKCRDMNKNGIMQLIGRLRTLGVYQTLTDCMICSILEQCDEDCSYRAYLGKPLDDDAWSELKRLKEIYMEPTV